MATFGKTNIGGTPGSFPDEKKSACLFTLAENARPTKFTVYFTGTQGDHDGGNARCLVYSVTAGEPDDLLLMSDIVSVPDGVNQWVDFPISSTVDLSPGNYYLGIICPNQLIGAFDAAGTNRLHPDLDVAAPDDPWVTAGTTTSPNQKSIYVTYDVLPTFGKADLNGVESYGNFPNANDNSACQFALPVAGSVTKLTVYYKGTWTTPQHEAGLVRGSIYASVGAVPSVLLGTTAAVNVPLEDGWIDFPFPSPVSLPAGDYFLCVNAATRKVGAMLDAGVNRYCANTYTGGQDAAWAAEGGDGASVWQKMIYATYVATAATELYVEVFGGFGVRPIPPSVTVLRAAPFETLHLLDTAVTNTAGTVLSRSLSEALHVAESPAAFVGGATHVASGGNIQAAVTAAAPGAVITLEAGGTYSSTVTITKPITITTLGWSHVGRVTMAQKASMAQIQLAGDNFVIRIDGGAANNVTLRGLFIAGPGNDIVLCGRADSLQQTLAEMPTNVTLDQCIIEGTNGAGRRGIGLHCGNGTVTRCHIHKIVRIGTDSTGIGGWNGPGPFTITDNYINAASEGILFGGADAWIQGTIPENILIDGNTFEKDPAWRGVADIKNHIELKTGRHVVITNNHMGPCWRSAQWYVFVITPAQYGMNENQQIADVLFANNVVEECAGFMNILGHSQHQDLEPTAETRDITIRDNWITVNQQTMGLHGWFMLMGVGPKNVVIEYNTIEMIGGNQWVTGTAIGEMGPPTGHVLRGNIIHNYGAYGTYLWWVDPETGQGQNYNRGSHFFDYFPGGICENNALIGAYASTMGPRLPGNLHGSTTIHPASLIVDGYGTGTLAGYGRRP